MEYNMHRILELDYRIKILLGLQNRNGISVTFFVWSINLRIIVNIIHLWHGTKLTCSMLVNKMIMNLKHAIFMIFGNHIIWVRPPQRAIINITYKHYLNLDYYFIKTSDRPELRPLVSHSYFLSNQSDEGI